MNRLDDKNAVKSVLTYDSLMLTYDSLRSSALPSCHGLMMVASSHGPMVVSTDDGHVKS